MPRESKAAKAARLLLEQRVTITHVSDDLISARVRGTGSEYLVTRDPERWSCECENPGECSHVLAVRHVTLVPPRNRT